MTESVVPMSLSQQGMYFDCQLRDAADYHVVLPLRIDPIPAEGLVRAVRQVMDEQPALRGAVRDTSDGSSYVVADSVEPPVVHHDLRGAESRFEPILDEAAEQPFELSSPPLFRVVHCELGDEDRLALICHHLIADGQSVSLLAERLITLARAETVPETPADTGFEAYQRQQTVAPSEKKSARRERFWRDNLARQESPDLSHWMNAGTDGASGRERRFSLDESLRESLAATARDAEVSEYTLYLAAFGLLLAQYAHADHVSVATPFTDRPGLDMESSIGCFIKTLPVHIDADPQQSVRAMVERLSREVLGSWKYLGHPVAGLLSEYPALTGVYDVTFIQDDYPDYPDGVRGAVRTDRVRFPGKLTVLVERIGATTELVFQYRESALSQDKVDRLAQRYLALLARIPESLDSPVATIRSTVDGDSADLLAQLTNTHYYDWQPIHLGEVFLAKTTAEPGRVAWSDETRDYSNAWAHDAAVLVQRRILSVTGGTKQPVAVLLPRSAELTAGLFGTVLAGCAYVPLAENTPTRRIAEILSDADISIVLTTSAAHLELPEGVTRLDIDEWDEFTALRLERRDRPHEQPTDVDRRPEDVLYVEYTSGSTGRPKGVVVRHANIQNTAMDLERRFPLEAEDRYLLKTAVTFDIFGTELYGWLFGDGRLDILPVGYEGDAPALLDWIRDRGVTHVNFTPTMLRVLLDTVKAEGRAGDLAGLRYLFSGGEALTADIVERFFALPLTCSLDNVYGPTEASMWATHTTVTAADTDPVASIGTPLNDYRVLILNPTGDLCGIDVPGEICIAGAGVAAGYLNRDELTADRFVTNPFFDPATDPEHMRRMYRTGDLGHLRADGRLAFIRRIDRQVKVGGVRMELGEIEQALLRTDGVLEAAVVVDNASTPPRLAGFYTGGAETAAVRASLAESLLPHMIPSPLVKLTKLPRSSAGKLDHRALTEHLTTTRPTAVAPRSALQERVAQRWRQVLGVTDLDVDASFFEQGGNSLSLMSLQSLLREEFGRDIRITELLKHHSVSAQARLFGDSVEEVTTTRRAARLDDDVAIIGIGIQVPGAGDVHQFWNNLRQGAESITFYDDEELRALGVPDADLRDPNYVKAHGRIDGLNVFDDKLFAIPPAEVDATSPQLRLLYKCFWQACEDAGYDPRALPGRVGVFAGGNDDFAWYQRALMNSAAFGDAYQNFTLATNHFLSTRLSYKFDLTGPSLSSLSGCSTSLLTVHQAAQSLRTGECDMAVAGGVTVELPNEGGYRYVDGMMLSPDGHCRPFDAKAAGTVFSNGAALLLLKPAADAIADGDPIYAVIKGSAVGNDGGRKPSYTAPSEDGQYETIRAAYDVSGIDPTSIGYIEAHGTGTLLGDPIEVASLSRVFADTAVGGCVLGSVKGNVGHTDSAAGSVGLSKVALSLKHRYLPGTRNFETANPAIDVETGPFTMSDQGRAWRGERLRAGINSFGVGGTNVHMIVEEAPTTEMTHDNPHELLRFAAASPEALNRTAEQVVTHLARHDEVSVTDAARTLRGRAELPFRKSITVATGESREGWIDRIASAATVRAADGARTALLFSGQGNQYQRMGYDLYRSRSAAGEIFRHWMDELTGLLPAGDAAAFADIVYGADDDGRIDRTEWTQFALFSTQYAMTKVLESFGVSPDLLVGHSIGELTAAALADVWSLSDAAHLVRERGKLMQNQPPGVMVAVTASADRIRRVVQGMDDVWVSLDNSVERSVLGMTKEAFGDVVDRLEAEGIRGSRLHTSNAFHTPMMTDAAKAFESILSDVESRDPSIPIISNRTGEVVRPGEMTDPAYWSEHITEQVRFTESLSTLMSTGPLFGIELGPGRSLATFAGADPKKGPEHQFVTVMRHVAETGNDEAYLLNALGTLWNGGLSLDWSHHDCGRGVSLPGYSFDAISHPQDVEIAVEPTPIEAPKPRQSPATDVLQGIRDAFQYVLGYPEVAADADFFALGGDSLKATTLSAQLESRLGIDVSVADIFGSTTPAALAERFRHTDVSTALRKAPSAEDYPLSPAQTRMFIAAKLDPGQLIYNMPSATLLHGTLDPDRTRSALRRLVERHEPLRTTFVMRGGEVRQRIAAPPTEPSLRFTTRSNAVADLDAVLADFVKPFDLVEGPLFRMEIVDGGDGGGLLLFDIHHIVADATSVEMLTRDFSRLYAGDLDPLPVQYTDFVMHVHGAEHQAALAESESHLLTALADPPTGDLLPTDHPRGEREPAAGRVELRLDATKVAGVKALAETHNATPFMVTLSAWGAVLARYAERDDLIIGAPVTGRTMAETREMAGMFVNLMPIRLRPTAADSVTDYLTDSRARVLEALTHQDVPFDRLVERLNLPRIPGRHPLFDISFDYHNMDHHDVLIDGITAQPLELPPLAVGMDLVITCAESADELTIHIDYAADLYERSTIEKLANHFDVLLERICEDTSRRLGEIPLYSDRQHAEVRAALAPVPFVPIHRSIADQAARDPQATAVIDPSGRRYSYAQLDALADSQAAKLRDAGLRTGDAVALFTVRDATLLIAQLAILKAGGRYVPLDPAQPRARLDRIIADARPRFAFAPKGTDAVAAIDTVIDLDTCREGTPTGFTGVEVGPEDPIYTVYTSGSTGVPKGITVKHRGVANLLRDHRERRLFGPGDVIISLADPTFDIFTFESLIPLACGAAVHMCPVEDQKDAAAIAGRIADHDVSHIQAPVSKMTALCGNGRFRSQLARLRVVVCGGEHFPETLLSLLRNETGARLFNMYGPTETTVTATVKEFGPGDTVTIGSPIVGAAVLIVGDTGMIQPDGVPGELCIAGEGLAAGYPNNPEQTRRAFTTITELPDVPVYRTGDAGLRLPDGDIILKGRLDHQVKLNGNRIELGEIEKTAMRVDGVSYAVALVDDDDLVLYYTATEDRSTAINAEISGSLPAYMKPGHLRRVADMPRLSNNKVDRNALRESPAAPVTRPASKPPRPGRSSYLDGILAVWQEVLGHPVRATDNFFEVGGTSYKLMLVNNRLGEEFGEDIPLVRLFENPTPTSLAESLGESEPPREPQSSEPLAPRETEVSDRNDRDEPTITMADLVGFDSWEDDRPAVGGKIAVIGMSGTFPGANTITQHWDNRADGVVSIARFTREELLASGIDEATVDDPDYVNARGHIDADTFDADFFGYSAKDAETMDPQLRLLHETTWHALEDAGYTPGDSSGDIALFVGSGTNFAWMAGFLNRRDDPIGAFEAMTMNEKDFLATKIAYKLNLTGPAVNVQTACSTSLVAIHEAVRCLRQGDADMALAGGVALNFPRKEGYAWHEGMIFSRDGVCRPFSQDAEGTVAGQGCGVVLLKPLDRAIEDGDHIYAVIAGSAVNNDGNTKVGYTAPSVSGQRKVIEAALADAGVDADDVGYIETHGTGTKLGDPIEYRALSAVYGRTRPCALGAVKANIGHLDAAAGVAGFIGAVGVLHRGQVPPMANFASLNENIEPSGSLYVPVKGDCGEDVRMAAVSSFGIGGTNAHLVLEAAPSRPDETTDDGFGEYILPISARTESSRSRMRARLEDFHRDGHPARDLSHTLAHGRAEFESRAAALAVPGQPLAWLEPTDPPLAVDAADNTRIMVATALRDDESPAAVDFRSAVEDTLTVFDTGLRAALRASVYQASASNVAIERISQFVIRVALIRLAGPDGLYAPTGADRLSRIASAFAQGRITAAETMRALKSGTAPPAGETTGPTPSVMDAEVDARLLRRLLASQWVRHARIDRDRFCANGKRMPAPGYAFEERRFVSDIRWDELGGTSTPASSTPRSTDPVEVLREVWIDVLGSQPADDADFLASGGDSLSAVHLCAMLAERTGITLTVGEVFADARYEAIVRLLEQATPTETTPEPVASVGSEATVFPASPAQKRMYAVCAMQNDTTAYNLAIAYRISGDLDIDRLREIFARLVERHDQLRTSFHLDGGDLIQRVHPEVPDVLTVVELTEDQARQRLDAEPRPFDLATAPLLRVEVLSVAGRARYLLIDMHHIIGDQRSLAVLAEDIAEALRGNTLPPPPTRYADYVAELERWEAAGRFDADTDFFVELLRDDVPRLELPTDRTAPESATFDGDRHSFVCSADRQVVTDLARDCAATPYLVFLTAITRLLGLYSGQREFVLGTAVSGRFLPGTDRTVGMFVNTLPVRVEDASERTVVEAVAASRDRALAVLDHQSAPFEAVLSRLDINPGGDAHPLFDVLFNYVNLGTEELELDGVRLEPVPPGRLKSRYALSLSVAERADDITVDIEYRTELFDAATIARLAGHLDHLLVEMTRDARRRISQLSLETPAERDRRRAALTAAGPAIEASLLDRVRDSFTRHAEHPALIWERREWSYAELDELTDSLAGGLQDAGVGVGDFVLCLLERGPWQVLSRIALLKCGAIEIPLDAATPAERIAHTLTDSGAAVVLCTDPSAHPWPTGVTAVPPAALTGTYRRPSGITAQTPHVMIYTSGTTGRPKGTLVPQGGLLSTCVDNGYLDYRPGDRVLHLTGYTFDPSLLDIYSAFLTGATLVMGSHAHNMDMTLLAALLREERVDKGILITAVFHLLMAENPEAVADMSAVYVGGEAMQPWAARRAFEILGPGRLFNLYGPTEASVCTTYFRVDETPDFVRMPIGVPARNRELFIVHPDGTDVPRGIPGELLVAGPSVAIGYHRRPELTAEKFPDAVGDIDRRLYRTGDRVVLDEDDHIVYLDRIDQQVKHAGYRIELSEIELAVRDCAGVVEAVVIHTAEGTDSRLTGFYTGESAPDEAELRRLLSAKLPRYMVPQRLVWKPQLPLTSHGKVDRKLLAARVEPVASAEQAPATADNAILMAFRDVLGIPNLSATDDFFSSGAQSLQAIAVVRRLRESGMDIQVSDVYRHPTAQALSALVHPETALPHPETAVRQPEQPRRQLPADRLRHMLDWTVADTHRFGEALTAAEAEYGFDIGAVARLHRDSGADTGGFMQTVTGADVADLTEAVAALTIRHEVLRARLVGDRFEILPPEEFEGLSTLLPVRDLRRLDRTQLDEFVDELALALQSDAFEGLLWRCVLVRESDDEVRLVWAFHHGVFDGFSAAILTEEIMRLARGEKLPDARRYSDFVTELDVEPDWPSELTSFDYPAWLSANRVVTDAVTAPDAAPSPRRHSLPLDGANPLELALTTVHDLLRRMSGVDEIAVAFVTNCRRWRDEDYSDCVGEFLDAVPVLLRGRDDQPAVAGRLAAAQDRGLHYVHSLSRWSGEDDLLRRLQAVYRHERGLDVTLVNFQGFIDADEMPETTADGPTLAHTHINIWHDDDSLHLEWIADTPTEAAGDRR